MANVHNAIILACQAHEGQFDKAGREYIHHPLAVMLMADESGANDNVLMTAILHDVVEDTIYTLSDLIDMHYPNSVIKALNLLTRRSNEIYDHYIDRCLEDDISIVIKYLDSYHNKNRPNGMNVSLKKRYDKTLDKLEVLYGLHMEGGKLNVYKVFPKLMRQYQKQIDSL
jgi:hypothetical protein